VKCPNCGFENIDNSAFCGSCGAALAAPAQVSPVQNDQPIPKKHTGRNAAIAIIVVAVIVIAALAVGLSMSHNNATASQKQVVGNGDSMTYVLSGTVNGNSVSGNVVYIFSNVTSDNLTFTSSSNSSYYEGSSTTYSYNVTGGIWTSPALTGMVLSNPSLKIGTESMSTTFGTKQVDHYQMTISGIVYDYYVAQGSGIPFKMVVNIGNNNEVMTLHDTSMDWIKNL
jgi:zinc-ribbon domain